MNVPGASCALDLGIEGVGGRTLVEALFALPALVVTVANLPPAALTVISGWVKLGAAPAVFAAWLVGRGCRRVLCQRE